MSMKLVSLVAGLLMLMGTCISQGGEMLEIGEASARSGEAAMGLVLKAVGEKKIYFGHQSVGFNIIDGINDIMKNHRGAELKILKTTDPLAFKGPVFAHSVVGDNEDPVSKIEDFARSIDNGIGGNAEIAFFKFCYVDITRTTDIEKVFAVYKSTMQRLKAKYPWTQFVHVTVPLTVSNLSLKARIKKIFGRDDNNIKRNVFNEMLLYEYRGKEPIFDLATIESLYADGSRSSFTDGGKTYYSLAPENTDDSGHLNEKGRRVMAAELLKFLSQIDTVR